MPEPITVLAEPTVSTQATLQPASRKSYLMGWVAACTVVLIWSSWLVASRSGALSALTIYDLAALRYGISSVVALPFVWYFKPWKTMTAGRIAVLTFLLSPVYVLVVFGGFTLAPAAHGGIFMSGVLPVVTLTIGWLWLREIPRAQQLLAAAIILIGTIMVVVDSSHVAFSQSWRGDLLFVAAAVFFSGYMIVSRLWRISTTQVLLCSAVINALIYVPVWYLFLPSGFADESRSQILLQAFYQGFVPNLAGLLLVAMAVRQIGSSATSAIMAGVPGMGAILSMVFLGEAFGLLGWFAVALLSFGIVMMAVTR